MIILIPLCVVVATVAFCWLSNSFFIKISSFLLFSTHISMKRRISPMTKNRSLSYALAAIIASICDLLLVPYLRWHLLSCSYVLCLMDHTVSWIITNQQNTLFIHQTSIGFFPSSGDFFHQRRSAWSLKHCWLTHQRRTEGCREKTKAKMRNMRAQ